MRNDTVTHDERTVAVENASYRWGYLLLSFGLLVIVAYRSFALQEAAWDLLALVVLGGLVTTFYQSVHKILSQRWGLTVALTVLAAVVVGAGLVLLMH